MFDALQPYIVIGVAFVVTEALKFLAGKVGLVIAPGTWLEGFAYAVGVGVTALLNSYALHLPIFLQAFVPLLVQGVLLWLSTLGFKTALVHARSGGRALAARLK